MMASEQADFMQLFWDLSAEDEDKRVQAAKSLLMEIKVLWNATSTGVT